MKKKKCAKCKKTKSLDEFHCHSKAKDGKQTCCKFCRNEYRREARREHRGCYANEYVNNREAASKRNKKYTARLKLTVLLAYSLGSKPSCTQCGFSDDRALSIDHIDGDGAQHRKEIASGRTFYKWLIDNDFPDGFQTLCMNCQFVKRHEQNEYRRMTPEIAPYRKANPTKPKPLPL